MNLLKISDSAYLNFASSSGGTNILEIIKSTDFSKYEIDNNSLNYISGVIDRKITDSLKNHVLSLLKNENIKLLVLDEKVKLPSYIIAFPMSHNGKLYIYLNITNYAKFEGTKLIDIEPRLLYSLSLYALTQYKLYKNVNILNDMEISDLIYKSYKKIIIKVINKIVNINILTPDEKLRFDLYTSIFISKILLRKSDEDTKKYLLSLYKKSSINMDKLETELKSIELDSLNSLSDYVRLLKESCASFHKLNLAQLLKEYAISMKNQAILSIDLIQVLLPCFVSISFGSYGIFNDKYVISVLDNRELDKIKSLISRFN